jgi:hypothetical protein
LYRWLVHLLSANYDSIRQKRNSYFFDFLGKSIWWMDGSSMDFRFYMGVLCKKEIMN